jgi:SNF2 family DNA or RNA helicase
MRTLPLFPDESRIELHVTFDLSKQQITFDWKRYQTEQKLAHGAVRYADRLLQWRITSDGEVENFDSLLSTTAIKMAVDRVKRHRAVAKQDIAIFGRRLNHATNTWERERFTDFRDPWERVALEVLEMGEQLMNAESTLDPLFDELNFELETIHRLDKRLRREEKRRLDVEAIQKRVLDTKLRKLKQRPESRKQPTKSRAEDLPVEIKKPAAPPPKVRLEIGPAETPTLDLFKTHAGIDNFLKIERASLMWISNQSDDLLCLPYCAIDHLEYQIRTALRVTGALRGRALLSDEVGLGKTIEAGLILKEYVTRGMVRRFLVLTVPSLIDQWAEELETKFSLACATSNQAQFRADPERFWTEQSAIVTSIHTFKLETHLSLATRRPWDMVIIDEAHHLRNRTSKSWQAVNALQRQFLLLLTATPVQNSLEELYNLVTLLKPGHLPSPREFRQRFVNRDRPYEPREPEQLRQLLGQVMIRNTRANANIKMPARHAETVLYHPEPSERGFWEEWDRELRTVLGGMPANKASLWGRLLLQAVGSSPAAWLEALEKFPDPGLADQWRTRAPLERSWERKTSVLPPLTRTEGGLVLFTQFLATQSALAKKLALDGVQCWILNGQTPAAKRQGMVEAFREHGGALLLTRSGTEGRNLQFCHRLVNFDLPWNPMEIEQRVGRLHRIGQERVVEIYNLVQAGTLQAHLLEILQEKLNLFDLIIGETGLILGDRFMSEDFEEEIFRRWQSSEGDVAKALQTLGEELSRGRSNLEEIKRLDETLFAHDYESI